MDSECSFDWSILYFFFVRKAYERIVQEIEKIKKSMPEYAKKLAELERQLKEARDKGLKAADTIMYDIF